jgi:hypothetical protein
MKKTILFFVVLLNSMGLFAQNITNTLGTNGSFIVRDATTVFLTLKQSNGCVGIGSNNFDPTNPEKLLVDCGTTTSVNAIYAKGTINSYFQFNIRNLSTGTQSSSDIVCTADNGTETTNFMNIGINGSGYVYQSGNPIETGGPNDCYVIASGSNLYIVNNNTTKDVLFLTGGTAATNERMRIKYNGYIGIGTNAPTSLFSVGASSKFQVNTSGNIVKVNNVTTSWPSSQGAANTYLKNDGNGNLIWGGVSGTIPSLTQGSVVFCNNSGPNLGEDNANFYWDVTNKRLAIGSKTFDATNPEKLKVDAGVTTSKNVISGYGTINSYLQLNIKDSNSGTSASSDLVATNDAGDESKGYIDIGINSSGYTDPAYNIGGKNDSYIMCVGNTGGTPVGGHLSIGTGSPGTVIKFHIGGSASANEKMRIDSAGNVGIGTTSPGTYKLNIVGNGFISGTWTQSSDIRLKTDVQNLQNTLEKIMKLRGVNFTYKNDSTKKKQIGFIAQEMEEVFPELVTTDANGYKGITYANVTAVLLEGIKEQQPKIDANQRDIEQIKKDIGQIKSQLSSQKKSGFSTGNSNPGFWILISTVFLSFSIVIIKKYIKNKR